MGLPHSGELAEEFSALKSQSISRWDSSSQFFTHFLFLSCLLKLSNFCTHYLNLYLPSPSFILKILNLTHNLSRLNNLSMQLGAEVHRLR